jgi:hypothetical protein
MKNPAKIGEQRNFIGKQDMLVHKKNRDLVTGPGIPKLLINYEK